MQFSIFYMSQAKNFLNFISTPKEIYNILDKFGYKPGNLLIKAVLKKGYAEEREHKIVLTKLGKARLKELETPKSIEIQPEPFQQAPEPERKNTGAFVLGIVGLLGFIFSVFQVLSSKTFMPYGIIGFLFLVSLILSIMLLLKKAKS